MFDSYDGGTGASITLTGLAITDVEIYKGTSMTQRSSDAGVVLLDTDGIDLDGVTGIHGFSIDTGDNTDAGFYTVGSFFTVVVSAVTIDAQTVNFVAGTFRLLAVETVSGTPQARASAIADGAITASTVADGTIDAATFAAGAINAAAIANGAIDAATFAAGAIDAAAIAAGAIDAATFAADVDAEILSYIVDDATRIDASALNTAAVTSIPAILADTGTDGVVVAAASKTGYTLSAAGLADFFDTDSGTAYASAVAGSVVKEIADNAGGSALTEAGIADAVWDEDATGHQTGGTFGQAIGDPVADTNTIYGAVVTGAAGATVAADIIAVKAETAAILDDTDDIGVAGAGLTAINLPDQTMNVTGNITGNLSGSVGSVTGAVGSVTGAVGSVAGNVDGNVTGTVAGVTPSTAAQVAAVLTTAITESYRANGAAPTLAQFMSEVIAHLGESAISGTTKTISKFDHVTAAETFTLDDATTPSSITRAT